MHLHSGLKTLTKTANLSHQFQELDRRVYECVRKQTERLPITRDIIRLFSKPPTFKKT